MAEVAGLVIGGISLAALFDQCLAIVKYVDSGRQCSAEYQDAALMLTLIGGRLSRWERTVREGSSLQTTEEDGKNAELWLKQVRRRLEEAEKLGQRYSVEPRQPVKPAAELSSMVEKVQARVMRRRDELSWPRKARWALIDQDKMQALIEKLDMLVGSLEKLFPTLQNARVQVLQGDVAGLIEGDDAASSPRVIDSLKAAAAKVDKDFEHVALSPSSHMYRNIENTDGAVVSMGDFVSADVANADGQTLRGGSHTYDGIRSCGKAVVGMGNQHGGKSIFELQGR